MGAGFPTLACVTTSTAVATGSQVCAGTLTAPTAIRTSLAACATVFVAGKKIEASVAAVCFAVFARHTAGSLYADLVRLAKLSALATVGRVGLQVGTHSRAVGDTGGTITCAVATDLPLLTNLSTAATVRHIDL